MKREDKIHLIIKMKDHTRKNIFICFCLFCYMFVCITILFYVFYIEELNVGNGPVIDQRKQSSTKLPEIQLPNYNIEVWGKASISLYLWKHIMKANVLELNNGMMQVGNTTIDNLVFSFKSGPGFIQTTVPSSVKHLVLVLNGRTKDKVKHAVEWLEYLPKFPALRKVAVILLGNERCENDWILPYMKSQGGRIDVVFLVYDSTLVDNYEFYQWPLGVAEYRGFPNVEEASLDCFAKRRYKYNFFGTVYQNSSRITLLNEIKLRKTSRDILLNERSEWIPKETENSLSSYINALKSSDLTFSPVGMNTECYRIYEAMSLGSVPIIEDVVTPGVCDSTLPAPLRLLKQYKAPIIWIKSWKKLESVFKMEEKLTTRQVVKRRIKIVKWYSNFKKIMKDVFIRVVKEKFTDHSIR